MMHQKRAANVISLGPVLWICLALAYWIPPDPLRADAAIVTPPLVLCSQYNNLSKLSDDHNVLCFDGKIRNDIDLTNFTNLNNGGMLVIRSGGGNIIKAMQIADILLEKRARVIIHDYCLSACANAIFVASHKTYVVADTIVAWHRSGVPSIQCGVTIRNLPMDLAAKQQNDYYAEYCKHAQLLNNFYKRRGIDDAFTRRPPTISTRQLFQLTVRQAADKDKILWMWNPANFDAILKERVWFQSYPQSQEEADAIVRRLRLPMRVIYDPPGER